MQSKASFHHSIRWPGEQDDYALQPTTIQPAIPLPIQRAISLPSLPVTPDPDAPTALDLLDTTRLPATTREGADDPSGLFEESTPTRPVAARKKILLRAVALACSLGLILALYITWHTFNSASASPTILQQSYGDAAASATSQATPGSATSSGGGNTVQVYILGAVVHPGVYILPVDARVYQLVQAAGGLLPGADKVALNLAAKLTDGEEIYVLNVGEALPANLNNPPGLNNNSSATVTPGQSVNINTATEAEMRQLLHISAATAQKIIAYRTQHGPYTAVTQLLQAVSKSVYDRIKNRVTV